MSKANMNTIVRLVEDIVTIAEAMDDFSSIEVNAIVRRNDGRTTDRIRMLSESGSKCASTKEISSSHENDDHAWF